MTKPIMLVDMDGPLADFERALYEAMPEDLGIAPEKRHTHFRAQEQYREEHGDDAADLVVQRIAGLHFYRTFPMVEGAKDGLYALEDAGWDVWICTTPSRVNVDSASDKIRWVRKNLGTFWQARLIITRDKTMVRGDVLWDDKPHIEGRMSPSWVHWIYDAPYNSHVATPHRANWEDNPWLH